MKVLSRYFTLRTLVFSVLGAGLLAVIEAVVTELSTSAEFDLRRTALAAVCGFVFSAVLERFLEAAEVITSARKTLEAAAAIEMFRRPVEMLQAAPTAQRELVQKLVHMAVVDHFGNTAKVSVNEYLLLLQLALEGSDSFSAIMRNPVRWFFEGEDADDRKNYLTQLRRRKMKSKLRVFLIDEVHLKNMNDDIGSVETMTEYWKHTGPDVETYWIGVNKLQEAYDNLHVPPDLGIFDDKVVIGYDDAHRTLTFNLPLDGADHDGQLILKRLREQLDARLTSPFVRIKPPPTLRKSANV